jgi:hypothetical protein
MKRIQLIIASTLLGMTVFEQSDSISINYLNGTTGVVSTDDLTLNHSLFDYTTVNNDRIRDQQFYKILALNPQSYTLYNSGRNLQLVGGIAMIVAFTNLTLTTNRDEFVKLPNEETNLIFAKYTVIGLGATALLVVGNYRKKNALKIFNLNKNNKLSINYNLKEVGFAINF